MDDSRPARIIGLGKGCAGRFTTLHRPEVVQIHSHVLRKLGVDYIQGDVLDDEEVKWKIAELIAQSGTSVLICDNGNKPREFSYYSRFLKSKDLILSYDYSANCDYFETTSKDKIWSFWQILDEHIRNACETLPLMPYLQKVFAKAAWLCRRNYTFDPACVPNAVTADSAKNYAA